LKKEIVRKIIHISSVVIPIGFVYVPKKFFILILVSLTFVSLAIEMGRLKFKGMERIFLKIFGNLLRPNEMHQITGATWLFLGASLSVILFKYPIALLVLLLLTICDAGAAIVGRYFGRVRIGEKTLEGSITFLLLGFITVIWIPGLGLTEKIMGVLIGTFLEGIKTPVNDNILVPLGTGTLMEIVRKISL